MPAPEGITVNELPTLVQVVAEQLRSLDYFPFPHANPPNGQLYLARDRMLSTEEDQSQERIVWRNPDRMDGVRVWNARGPASPEQVEEGRREIRSVRERARAGMVSAEHTSSVAMSTQQGGKVARVLAELHTSYTMPVDPNMSPTRQHTVRLWLERRIGARLIQQVVAAHSYPGQATLRNAEWMDLQQGVKATTSSANAIKNLSDFRPTDRLEVVTAFGGLAFSALEPLTAADWTHLLDPADTHHAYLLEYGGRLALPTTQ